MPEIAIIGAGIAGLSAALTLQDAGLSCTIYEASNRIGGRMHSDTTTWADGMVSERCGEFIDGNHETIHQLIKRFGLNTIDLGWGRANRAQYIMYFFNRHYGAEELARDFQALAPLLQQQLQALERKSDASLTLTFATAGSSSEVHCERAILTLPFSILRQVDYQRAGFDPLKQVAIEQLGYGTISKLYLQFDMPYWYENGPWPHPHSGFIITDLDIQTLWDASIGQTGSSGLLVDYR